MQQVEVADNAELNKMFWLAKANCQTTLIQDCDQTPIVEDEDGEIGGGHLLRVWAFTTKENGKAPVHYFTRRPEGHRTLHSYLENR